MELVGFGESEGADLLQKLPLFSKLTFEETQRLAQIATFHEVNPGAVVIEPGDIAECHIEGLGALSNPVRRRIGTGYSALASVGV